MWGGKGITLPPRTLSPRMMGCPPVFKPKAVDEAGRLSSVSRCPSFQLEHQLQLFFSAPLPPTHPPPLFSVSLFPFPILETKVSSTYKLYHLRHIT